MSGRRINHWLWAGLSCTSPFNVPSELKHHTCWVKKKGRWDWNLYCKCGGSYRWRCHRIDYLWRRGHLQEKQAIPTKSSGVHEAPLLYCLSVPLWCRKVRDWNGTSWDEAQCASGWDGSLGRRTRGLARRQMSFFALLWWRDWRGKEGCSRRRGFRWTSPSPLRDV